MRYFTATSLEMILSGGSGTGQSKMPANLTREDFARLVLDLRAELEQVTEGRRRQFFTVPRRAVPKSWEAYPWAREYAGVDEVMKLTGLTRNSVRLFDSQARVARRNGHVTHSVKVKGGGRADVPRRLMPPSVSTGRHRRWMLGELALWMAIREDRQAVNSPPEPDLERIARVREIRERDGEVTGKGIAAELGVDTGLAAQLIAEAGLKSSAPEANYASDSQLLDAAREAVRRHGPGVEVAVIGKKIQAAGTACSRRGGSGRRSYGHGPSMSGQRWNRAPVQAGRWNPTDGMGSSTACRSLKRSGQLKERLRRRGNGREIKVQVGAVRG